MSPKEETLRREILDYLARHPQAKDTIEGIVEWWLLEQRIVDTMTEVEKVLAKLVADKLVLREDAPDGNVFFSCNPNRGH